MENNIACLVCALNLDNEAANFLKDISQDSFIIKNYPSPEVLVSGLKEPNQFCVIAVSDDYPSRMPEAYNRLIELLYDDFELSAFPIISISSEPIDFENREKQTGLPIFASAHLVIKGPVERNRVILKDTIVLGLQKYQSLQKFFLKKQQEINSLRRIANVTSNNTGLLDRRSFCLRIQDLQIENPNTYYTLAVWNIDNFKVYNDNYGALAGDELINRFSEELLNINILGGAFAHLGGDIFAVFIESRYFSGIEVQKLVTQKFSQIKPGFDFVVRMGVYRCNELDVHPTIMLDRAYMAMRSTKGNYESRIAYYDDAMRGQLIEVQEVINDMTGALKNEEFVVFYQPQYNFATGEMTGAEALVRWNHPTKGFISPGKFIPIFESNGFITHLDEYIWEKVCKTMREWIDEGINLVPISVNISRRDICKPTLCSFLISLMHKYRIPFNLLRLEITESAYMQDPDQLINVVQTLRRCGFCVEMDDFGSGYSSLNTLKDVPVDVLKLDMKFLVSQVENPRSSSILSSVVRMAKWLNLPVIAEGIENKEQAEFLKSIGCWTMQGFYFSMPINEVQFKTLLEKEDVELLQEIPSAEGNGYNVHDFLDVNTQNALLFNTFVGGAAILELNNNKVEVVRANDKFFEVLGIPREEYMTRTKNLLDRFPTSNAMDYLEMLHEAYETGKEATCEILNKPFDDYPSRWTRTICRYLAQYENSTVYYITVQDITKRVNLLIQNTYLAQELTNITENVPCGIMKAELQRKDDKGKLLFVNKYILDLVGFSEQEFAYIFENEPKKVLPEKDFQTNVKLIKHCIDSGETEFSANIRYIKKDGTLGLFYQLTKINYRENDVIHVMHILVDLDQKIGKELMFGEHSMEKYCDMLAEFDFKNRNGRAISSKVPLKDEYYSTHTLEDGFFNWVEDNVFVEDRQQLKDFMTEENFKNCNKNGTLPFLYFRIVNADHSLKRTSVIMLPPVKDSLYLACYRFLPD